MSLEFGAGIITCQRFPGDARTDQTLYAEALEFAERAEALGLDSVFVSEHHFVDDGYTPSVLPLCAAIAARTCRIRVGTGILLAPLHHPIRLAEDAAIVDLIAGGRLILGLGLGWREEELAVFGVPSGERARRLERAVAVLRESWSNGLVTSDPSLPSPVAVWPKPCTPGGPPIWIGAMSEPALRRAGRIADGVMATEVTTKELARQLQLSDEEHAGRAVPSRHPFVHSVHLPVFPWVDGDAFALSSRFLHYVTWKYADMDVSWGRTAPVMAPAPDADDLASVRAKSLVGTPPEVAEAVAAYCMAAHGDLHFVARVYLPGLPREVQLEALRVFACEVVPAVRRLTGNTEAAASTGS
jgi:alkanesulfonate monooxygenase SsuD/methylene tetrahydromethanopterin reductase-like flavin-dependent oxidoreductase (luciferase family)